MAWRWAATLALVLLIPSLTGCLGMGGDDAGPADGLDTQSRAEVTAETGGIEGVVTDEAVEPIPEATVELVELSRSTTTAEDGSFAFSEVQPATYTLAVTKDGFIGAEQAVEVASGAVSTAEIVLAHEPTIQPYSQQWEFSGFMECSFGAGTGVFIVSWSVCSASGNATNSKTAFTHSLEPNAWQIVTEVTWDANTPLGDRFWMNSETEGFNNAWRVAYANERGTSPIVAHTTRADLARIAANFTAICNGEIEPSVYSNHRDNPDAYCNHAPLEQGDRLDVTVSTQASSQAMVDPEDLAPIGAGATIQQEFTIYRTVFYNTPACEDYSLVEGNECDQRDEPPAEDPADSLSGDGNESSGGNRSA